MTTTAIGHFFVTFENSLGNINSPSIDILSKKVKLTALDYVCIYLIYLFWWGAQIVLLVVLLNFVIALISQYYEDVMNNCEMHTYVMRQGLNQEYFVFNQFMVKIGKRKDEMIDAMLLINGETAENEGEWLGLT